MTFKKLLLGAAAATVLAGSAQAADLVVVEPVDYVRICDAYGNTYWYSPGTNTCLSITGYVRAEVRVGGVQSGVPAPPAVPQANVAGPYGWRFQTKAALAVTARSMTEWGPLVGYMRLAATSDNNTGQPVGGFDRATTLEEGYFSIGNFLGGYTGSIYAFSPTANVPYKVFTNLGVLRLGNVDQFRYSWVLRSFSLAVAVEDPRDRAAAGGAAPALATMAFPDVVAAMAFGRAVAGNTSRLGLQLSAGVGARTTGLTFGAQVGVVWQAGERTQLHLVAAYSPTGPDFVSGINGAANFLAANGAGTYFAVQGGIQHDFSSRWSGALNGGYASGPGGNVLSAIALLDFTPVENFTIRGEASARANQGAGIVLSGGVRFTRAF